MATLLAGLVFVLLATTFAQLRGPGNALARGGCTSDGAGTLRLLPESSSVEVGRPVTMELWLENGSDYYGIDVRLKFDPAVLQVPLGRVTPLWEVLDAENHFTLKNEADNTNGTLWYAAANVNPADAFTGTGRILAIAFTGVASGTTSLSLTFAQGTTRDGRELVPVTLNGTILVVGAARHALNLPMVLATGKNTAGAARLPRGGALIAPGR